MTRYAIPPLELPNGSDPACRKKEPTPPGQSVATGLPARLVTRSAIQRVGRRLVACCGVGVLLTVGLPVAADEPYVPVVPIPPGGDGIDSTGTVPGNIIESTGDYVRDRGKALYFRSLSARQYQAAIDRALDNRRESIQSYYDMKALRDAYVKSNRLRVTDELAREIAERGAPERLTSTFLNSDTGELRWPEPLDAEALSPYRKPIEEAFKKRSSPGSAYTLFDHLKVHRMVDLMQEALEMIKDGLPVREYIALDEYLTRISFESRFDASGERIDLNRSLSSETSEQKPASSNDEKLTATQKKQQPVQQSGATKEGRLDDQTADSTGKDSQ